MYYTKCTLYSCDLKKYLVYIVSSKCKRDVCFKRGFQESVKSKPVESNHFFN